MFIKDLDKGINSEVAKCVADTKLFRLLNTRDYGEELHRDLTKLGE